MGGRVSAFISSNLRTGLEGFDPTTEGPDVRCFSRGSSFPMNSHTNDNRFPNPQGHRFHDETLEFEYDDIPFAEEVPDEPVERGYTLVSWIVILLLVGGLVTLQAFARNAKSVAAKATNPIQELTAKAIVGASTFADDPEGKTLQTLEGMKEGSFRERASHAIYAGEIVGPERALEELNAIEPNGENGPSLSEDEPRVLAILRQLYSSYKDGDLGASSITEQDRELLVRELGWTGKLALVPEGSADTPNGPTREDVLQPAVNTFLVLAAAVVGGIFLVFVGLLGVLILGVLFATQTIRWQFTFTHGYAGVYAETFAVWLLLVGGGMAARYFVPGVSSLAFGAAAMLVSLLALGWPVLRGVPWSQMRRDIGLHFGNNPFVEGLFGLAGYPLILPFLCVGFVVVNLLVLAGDALGFPIAQLGGRGPSIEGAHPIVSEVAGANSFWDYALIFFLASFVAPLVEEIMFRGVLYGHLRELSGRWGRALSVFGSALLVSFVFAIIHPQALIAVPLLMSLAFGFALLREWRGSLFPAMVAHGLSNALVLGLLTTAVKVAS